MKPEENISLNNLTTFKSGGPARFLFSIQRKEELADACRFASEKGLQVFVLGGGSNVLVSDEGFSGVVIKIETKGIVFSRKGEDAFVESEAGEDWDDLVSNTVDKKLWGLENLSAIPGTVGASAVQNIGAYGVEAKDFITEVEIFDRKNLSFKILKNADCHFGYRESIFKSEEGKNFIVTKVTFKLSLNGRPNISYKDLAGVFSGKENLSAEDIRKEVISIRSKKFPDLFLYGTAGSFFKNIIVDEEKSKALKNAFPGLVFFDMPDGRKKVSTASLLDKICGLRGFREGNVGLFPNQPLVVVNFGEAKAEEIKKFIEKIKKIVKEKTSLELEEEVVVI